MELEKAGVGLINTLIQMIWGVCGGIF